MNEQYCQQGVVCVDDQILSIKTTHRNADGVHQQPKVLAFDVKNDTK